MPVTVLGRLRKRNRGGKALQDRRPGGQPPAGPGDRAGQPRRGGAGQAGRARPLDLLGLRCRQVALRRADRDRLSSSTSTRSGAARTWPAWPSPCRPTWTCSSSTPSTSEAEGINIGEALRTAATRLLDMGPDDLQLLLVQQARRQARPADLRPDAGRLGAAGADARPLAGTDRHGQGAAGRLRPGLRDGLLRLPEDLPQPVPPRPAQPPRGPGADRRPRPPPEAYRDIVPVFEEEKPGDGTPSNHARGPAPAAAPGPPFPGGVCRQADRHHRRACPPSRTGCTRRPRWRSTSTA